MWRTKIPPPFVLSTLRTGTRKIFVQQLLIYGTGNEIRKEDTTFSLTKRVTSVSQLISSPICSSSSSRLSPLLNFWKGLEKIYHRTRDYWNMFPRNYNSNNYSLGETFNYYIKICLLKISETQADLFHGSLPVPFSNRPSSSNSSSSTLHLLVTTIYKRILPEIMSPTLLVLPLLACRPLLMVLHQYSCCPFHPERNRQRAA